MATRAVSSTAETNSGVQVGQNAGSVVTHHYHGGRRSLPSQNAKAEVVRPRTRPLRTRNPLFLGRAAEVADIESRLIARKTGQRTSAPKKPLVAVIQALGGSGKSELCLHYVHKHDSSYWASFWVDGSSESSLKLGFKQIARQLRLASDDVEAVLNSLASSKRTWLLVIDNADDPELDLAPYLPAEGIGHVIITTRNPKLDIYDTTPTIQIEGLAPNDARALLFKAAKIPAEEQGSLDKVAEDILKTLNYHTLAIIQAGAFIRKTRDFHSYIKFFGEQRKVVLDYCDVQARSQYGSVYATFEVSASKLKQEAEERQVQAAADALDLLHLFAFMDSRGPFERIFRDARDSVLHYSPDGGWPSSKSDASDAVVTVDRMRVFIRKQSHLLSPVAYATDDLLGKYRWREACDKLHQFSMLAFETDQDGDEVLTFHPLVLAWALSRQSKDMYRKSWLSVATTICLSSRGAKRHSPQLARLSSHSRVCASNLSIEWWTEASNLHFLFLLYRLSWILQDLREDDLVARVCQCMDIALKTAEGQDSPRLKGRESIQYRIGTHAYDVRDLDRSVQLLEHVLKIREETLEESNADLLSTQHELAGAYVSQGQIEKALELLEHVVKIKSENWPETSMSLLASKHELARVYRSNGRTTEGIELLEHISEVEGQMLTESHPSRLTSQFELAKAYRSIGRVSEAMQLLEHVVKVEKESLAPTHPDRLITQHELARTYYSNGRVAEAVQLLEKVVDIDDQTSAATHSSQLSSRMELAKAYRWNGQVKEALELLEDVVRIRKQKLAETHPDLLSSQYQLAKTYHWDGQSVKAIELLQHVAKVEEHTLTETHHGRIATQHELARAYVSNGQTEEAVALFERLVKLEESLPATDTNRINSQYELARAYKMMGQLPKAVELIQHVVMMDQQMLEETNHERQKSEEMLQRWTRLLNEEVSRAQMFDASNAMGKRLSVISTDSTLVPD